MASDRVKALENGIRLLIKPELVCRGFSYEASTRTFRRPSSECIQIVDFQIGVRSMAGQFTVNLAVFHPEYGYPDWRNLPPDQVRESHCLMAFRCRLSALRDTPFTRFFRRLITDTDSFLKWWLITPTDRWWSFTPDDAQVEGELNLVRGLLLAKGLDWLDQNSDVELLKAAHKGLRSYEKVAD
jgi:hypothetical protein